MNTEEYKAVKEYINEIYQRINGAKAALEQHNYGIALDILSAPFPPLTLIKN